MVCQVEQNGEARQDTLGTMKTSLVKNGLVMQQVTATAHARNMQAGPQAVCDGGSACVSEVWRAALSLTAHSV